MSITKIGQLANEKLEFLDYQHLVTKFGNGINFSQYYGAVTAIKKYKESLDLKDEPNTNTHEAKLCSVLQSRAKGTKAIRKILNQNTAPKAVGKWNNEFVDLDWPVIYSNLIKSSDRKLKWFQYRILYRILTTNDYLYQ